MTENKSLSTEIPKTEITRYSILPGPLKIICLVFWLIGLGLFVTFVFGWNPFGYVLEDVRYYFYLYAAFTTTVFLILPMRKKKDATRIPLYDIVFAALMFGICIYWSTKTYAIMYIGLVPPDNLDFALGCIISLLAIEGGRRMAGLPFMIICLVVATYPLYAAYLPGLLYGTGYDLRWLVGSFTFGREGLLGLAPSVIGTLLIGFLLFAGILIASGAGKFFLNLALGLLGTYRGGPAKVAVLASGFFGSLSGSPMSNIITTGSVTIPAMKRLGYPPHYAGAVEAVASTGGVLMPPVMGFIAFFIVIITEIPYPVVLMGAVIPALLYYWGLLVQVDSYAAKEGLKGLPKEEIPSLWKTLKGGWIYIVVLGFLVFGLLYMRWGVKAPIYASGVLIFLSYIDGFLFGNRESMMTPRRLLSTLSTTGSLVAYIMAILMPIAFIFVAVGITGSLVALTAELVSFVGVNPIVLLLIGCGVCYVMGMAGSGAGAVPYIVLAVTAVPTLVQTTGLNLLGIHLFLAYYGMTSGITPPVAISSFVAAAIADANPMKTAWQSVQFAAVLYFIPFFFVFNPALIMQPPSLETLYLFALCIVGIWLLASGLQGYLIKVGKLHAWSRPFFVVAGFLVALPDIPDFVLLTWQSSTIGVVLAVFLIVIHLITKKAQVTKLPTV
ncbi:TRAP transporter permease [Chloroflexota bacterium]